MWRQNFNNQTLLRNDILVSLPWEANLWWSETVYRVHLLLHASTHVMTVRICRFAFKMHLQVSSVCNVLNVIKDISTKITGMGIQSMENFQIECKLSKSWNMPVFRTYFRPNQKFYSIFLNFRDHQEIVMSSVVSKQWKGLSWNLRGKEEVWYDLPLIAKWKEMREITTTLSFAVLFEKCKTSSSNQKVKKHY